MLCLTHPSSPAAAGTTRAHSARVGRPFAHSPVPPLLPIFLSTGRRFHTFGGDNGDGLGRFRRRFGATRAALWGRFSQSKILPPSPSLAPNSSCSQTRAAA